MERKLGIDWEHPPDEDIDEANSDDERESRESFQSVQTNQIIDGGYEGVETEIDDYSNVDKVSVYKRQPGFSMGGNNLMTSESSLNPPDLQEPFVKKKEFNEYVQ